MKRVFRAGHLMVTTVAGVRVENTRTGTNSNFRQLFTLKGQAAGGQVPENP